MKRYFFRMVFYAILVGVVQPASVSSDESLVPAASSESGSLQEQIDSVLPRPEEERWLRIPWQPNLMRGRLESQRNGRPMLIWVMDGNVLGCT